jgi:polygalacturonase
LTAGHITELGPCLIVLACRTAYRPPAAGSRVFFEKKILCIFYFVRKELVIAQPDSMGPWLFGVLSGLVGTLSPTLLESPLQQQYLFNVLEYGAVGDGVTDDGRAIEEALTAASAAADDGSSVTVLLPALRPGTVYIVRRPLTFNASNSFLDLQAGATLRWQFDPDLSFLDSSSPHKWPDTNGPNATRGGHVQLLSIGPARNQGRLQNVTIGGGGVFDGSGFMWWPLVYHVWEYCCDTSGESRWGPYFTTVTNIDGLRITNITLVNPPMITFDGPAACTDVEMSWINITAPWQTPEDFYSRSPTFAEWRETAPISKGNKSRIGRAG